MHKLSSVTRRTREALTELCTRIEGIVKQLESLNKSTGKEVYGDIFFSIFIHGLPKDFSYILTEADMKKSFNCIQKSVKI